MECPQFFFSVILRSEALVHNSYFFQNSRFTVIIQQYILTQTLLFLTRLPTQLYGKNERYCKPSKNSGSGELKAYM